MTPAQVRYLLRAHLAGQCLEAILDLNGRDNSPIIPPGTIITRAYGWADALLEQLGPYPAALPVPPSHAPTNAELHELLADPGDVPATPSLCARGIHRRPVGGAGACLDCGTLEPRGAVGVCLDDPRWWWGQFGEGWHLWHPELSLSWCQEEDAGELEMDAAEVPPTAEATQVCLACAGAKCPAALRWQGGAAHKPEPAHVPISVPTGVPGVTAVAHVAPNLDAKSKAALADVVGAAARRLVRDNKPEPAPKKAPNRPSHCIVAGCTNKANNRTQFVCGAHVATIPLPERRSRLAAWKRLRGGPGETGVAVVQP